MFAAIIIFFCFNFYIFTYASKILVNFKKNKLIYIILAFVNTFLMVYAYKLRIPYYVSYFCVLVTLTIQFLLFSEAKFSQAFLCSGILIINISITQIIFIPIYSYILGVTPYEVFNNETLFYYCLAILFIILFIVFKITLKDIFLDDIIKISTEPIYSKMISIIIVVILIYSITDIIAIQQERYIVEYLPLFIIMPMLSYILFNCLFFYSIKSVKIVAFKRKSDELEIARLKNAASRRNIENKILKDDLTDCYNRKYIMNDLKNKEENNIFNFAILFIDIDDLKVVNDNLGHEFGDEYIVNISNMLKTSIRENDLIARIGGDEFLIILNDLQESDVKEVLSRINKKIDYLDKTINNYKVSASIGYIFVDESLLKTGIENIIKIADDKMRTEKNNLKGE